MIEPLTTLTTWSPGQMHCI